jgi:hypothetical protein
LIAFLANPHNPNAENDAREAQLAARALDVKLLTLNVGSEPDLDAGFATLTQQRAGALLVDPIRFLLPGPIRLLRWRHATELQQSTICVNSPRPAVWQAM